MKRFRFYYKIFSFVYDIKAYNIWYEIEFSLCYNMLKQKNVSNSVYFGLPQLDLLCEEKLFKGKRKRKFL